MNNEITNYQRAKLVVSQIKGGEWRGRYNSISMDVLTIERKGVEIWVGNLSFNCEVYRPNAIRNGFGLIWRHWVWFAAQSERKRAIKEVCNKDKTNLSELDGKLK